VGGWGEQQKFDWDTFALSRRDISMDKFAGADVACLTQIRRKNRGGMSGSAKGKTRASPRA
jgi:hypothetical protein